MAFYNWQEFFLALENWGFSKVLLPFLLIFTLVFAILEKTHVLGEKKSYNVVLAFVMAFATIIASVTGDYFGKYNPVEILNRMLPSVSLLIIAVIMLLLLVGIFGAEADWRGANTISGAVVILAVIAVVWIFGSSAGWWQGWGWLSGFLGSDAVAIIIMVLVFAIIIWFVTRDETTSSGDGFMKNLGDFFKKK